MKSTERGKVSRCFSAFLKKFGQITLTNVNLKLGVLYYYRGMQHDGGGQQDHMGGAQGCGIGTGCGTCINCGWRCKNCITSCVCMFCSIWLTMLF